MVPVSGELTAAVGLLAASAALGVWGEELLSGLLGLIRGGISVEDLAAVDASAFAARVRSAIGTVSAPLTGILAAPVLASLLAHQLQAGGLFQPALALPDPARLRPGASGGSPGVRLGRAVGVVLRGAVVVPLVWWMVRGVLRDPATSDATDAAGALLVAWEALHASIFRLGLALLAVGLVHLAFQARQIRRRLQMTPEERREEQRSYEGDPGLRSRRRAARGRSIAQAEAPSSADPV